MSAKSHATNGKNVPPTKLIKASDRSKSLVIKLGKVLKNPGIKRSSVFCKTNADVFAYSVHPSDPSRVIREAVDGTLTVGKVVRGKFKSLGLG